MINNELPQSGLDVIYLTSCALHGIIPDSSVIANMDISAVYEQAKRHKMLSVTCMALENYWDILDPVIINNWKLSITKAVRNAYMFSVEREKLFRFMDDNEIAYLPLKGIIMQNVYPKLGMRQMVDNDILIDREKRHLVKRYMEDNGYKVEMYGRDMHDIYIKPPIFNFEIHVCLCNESVNPIFYQYYEDVWSRLVKDNEKGYGFHFTKEDFYIHILVHAYKHFSYTGGIGIKALTDVYVYSDRMKEELDQSYIKAELTKLKLTEFERSLKQLAERIYDISCVNEYNITKLLNEEEKELLKFFIDSGSFGNIGETFRQRLERFSEEGGNITKKTKTKYLIDRLFPTGLYLKENYPFFYKHKALIPFFWIYRFFSKIFVKFGDIINEVKFISKQK